MDNFNYYHFFNLKPGDVIWLTPIPLEDTDSAVGIDGQEIGLMVKSVIFTPNRKIPEHITIGIDKTEIKSSDDVMVYIESVEIQYFNDEEKIRCISGTEIHGENVYYGDLKYSSITVDK